MNICQIINADVANGPGIRLSIFVSGCTNHCKGCFQPETWDFDYGQPVTGEMMEQILGEASKPFYSGITILGGEPMEPCNQFGLVPLLEEYRKRVGKSVWIFTGFTYDKDLVAGGKRYIQGVTDQLLSMADVLVDGRFVEEEKDPRLHYRGSKNQQIIELKPTLAEGKVVLSDLN